MCKVILNDLAQVLCISTTAIKQHIQLITPNIETLKALADCEILDSNIFGTMLALNGRLGGGKKPVLPCFLSWNNDKTA